MTSPRRALITGGAGFIGSNLADRLHALGSEVVILDDFRTGRREFLSKLVGQNGFELIEGDVLDERTVSRAVDGCEWVFHLQANADVRHGLQHPHLDLEQNTIATARVLEAMRNAGVSRILFSSTGSVYGEPDVFPTPERAPFPIQTSLYGASKLACEGLLAAYATGYGFTSLICRFVSILGERYTHGHVFDFYRALKNDSSRLRVLGDGQQEKSYLYVQDCVDAILTVVDHHSEDSGTHIYNLGTEQTVVVDESIAIITAYLGVRPAIEHTGGRRGWTGDSPLIRLDTTRIRSLGWEPRLTIEEGIRATLAWFEENEFAWAADGTEA
jgi:UDP-glucose 4-epimerase